MEDKIKIAVERFRTASEMSLAYYHRPLLVAYSGGKDSEALLGIAKLSCCPYEVEYSLTSADSPITVYHVKSRFKQLELQGVSCSIYKPTHKGKRVTMWNLIPRKKFPPIRTIRYCCEELKECMGVGRFIATGVRWEESYRRRGRSIYESLSKKESPNIIMINNDNDDKRLLFESCIRRGKKAVNPVIDWGKEEIIDFIKYMKMDLNPMYSMGFERVGCIGCPLASRKCAERDFEMFPKYKMAYIRAFDQMLKRRGIKEIEGAEYKSWETGEEVFNWWIEGR